MVKKRPATTEWIMVVCRVLGMGAAVFLYGEHQLNAVNTHAETLIGDERRERREDLKQIDAKLQRIMDLLLEDDKNNE